MNARITPTPAFQRNPDLNVDQRLLLKRIADASRSIHDVDATGLGLALLGDTIAANLFMLGYASQLGLLPVSASAIERAVELNAVAVKFNLTAFMLGRLQVVDPERVDAAAAATRPVEFKPLTAFADIVAHRERLLTEYQDAGYARRYRELVDLVAAAEGRVMPGSDSLAVMVARNFAKLMAYKDEYEVARLHADPAFREQLKTSFEDGARLRYNLAPPLFARRDPSTGELQKREFGAWMGGAFSILSRFKRLRGTPFDVFGYTAERRMERGLIDRYEAHLREVAGALTKENHKAAVELASLPAQIRGFGHVKEANVEKVRPLEERALARFREPARTEVDVRAA